MIYWEIFRIKIERIQHLIEDIWKSSFLFFIKETINNYSWQKNYLEIILNIFLYRIIQFFSIIQLFHQ